MTARTNDGAWARVEKLKQQSTGQLLLKCARLLDERAVGRVARASKEAARLRPAHTRLFPHIDAEGTRLTELARRVGVTKQAVGQLVDELARMGTVTLEPDPEDGRARRVRFTPRGVEGIAHGLGVLAEIEGEVASKVGKRRMKELHDILAAMVPVLESLG